MVAEYHPLIACSKSFVSCFVCMQVSHVLYATKCLNKMSYWITQCYLLAGDTPAFTPKKAGTRFSDPGDAGLS